MPKKTIHYANPLSASGNPACGLNAGFGAGITSTAADVTCRGCRKSTPFRNRYPDLALPDERENLTNAGKGRPNKRLKRVLLPLSPELLDRIDEIAQQQDWARNYTVEQLCRAMLDLNPDYDEADFALIRAGLAGE